MTRLDERAEGLAGRLDARDAAVLLAAYRLARHAHAGQRRRHGPPFIEHPVAVAWLAHDRFGVRDGRVLGAAMLHDVLEDTDVRDLSTFPARTVHLVQLLTDPDRELGVARRRRYAEIWADRDATLLKACDRLSNLSDALLQYDPGFSARWAWRTRSEMLQPGLPLHADPVARPLLEEAIRRCEAVADQ
ncbi:MAG TPA: HD domain-containing protein [Candidatus Dormibacteraeota bacterium]|nr:HD domain-containing protein [Candidatus Dormibacteraeota bacterium]